MLVDAIEIQVKKEEAINHIFRRTPLMSKIDQFNRKVENIHLEYIEYKILNYEIISRKKNKNNFRSDDIKYNIIVLINTYNGYCQSIKYKPKTTKRYVVKSCIKKSNIKEEHVIEKVKDEIISYFNKLNKNIFSDKLTIKSIKLLEKNVIYKPYWIGSYKGKEVFISA